MKWGRIETEAGIVTGVIADGMLHPRAGLGSDEAAGDPLPLADARLLAPCQPGKFIGLWNNFHAAAEKNGNTIPDHPLWFLKPDSSVTGHGSEVELPAAAGRCIFEGELGIVIGQTIRQGSEAEAEAAILGYTCVNDITSLDVLNADPAFPQWTRSKGFEGFGVLGPVIETDVDWRALTVKVLVGGRERQSYAASDMILSPAEIVSKLSHDVTFSPGDVIACGTSLGARPIRAGQEIEVVIEGIGAVSVTTVAPSEA
ncbi:fumarylacetoacetate hydrolase family protein [Aestuariicoccus sp. MJ-SS9]|uniref:fumarylacetoacetate hydrolase family protein n=1 Tax=Aestuariicoccus sp. MJ-SS9 TaxID=3079855 RepID=UPI002913CF8C|nr:fumarylacetoacetate hydrolase family protein [Aestuariicoccus sp. MJ-SS9]MDU8911138.1 fumarylacetoacetate hydrolase family protein [Aestuariicoccus sp. MJ-SS9]